MPLHTETPRLESPTLSSACGPIVDLKLEALQPTGSFKLRGMGHACEHHARQGVRRFLSSSGGNAGIAVAYAGRELGIPVTVVVPASTTECARRTIEHLGADLTVHGASWQEAHAHLLSLAGDDDAVLHPFDDPLLWRGHATMIDEAARQGTKPDAIVLSVGGGGLLCGVVEGLRRNGWADVPVVAVETCGAASLHASLDAGHRVTLDAITSIATSLGAKQVCQRAFDLAQEHPVTSVVVSDAAAVRACLLFNDDHRIVVEPACGAALALAYDRAEGLIPFERVLIIVCGGTTTPLAQLESWASSLQKTPS